MASEAELHRHIFVRSADLVRRFPQVILGPGDDCAVVRSAPELSTSETGLLLTVDHLIEGRHFTTGTPVAQIAHKAMARSASDIAAMGGKPTWSLAAAILPQGMPESQANELFDACARIASEMGAPLVGGDLATSPPLTAGRPFPLTLSITMGGEPLSPRGPVLRSTARVGDDVFVTGRIGGSYESGRHMTFLPRVAEGLFLVSALGDDLHAMIDVSDGLGRDAGRVAEASGVRIEIDALLVPLNDGCADVLWAAAEGEDYELLFTTAPGALARVRPPAGLAPMIRIGRVVAGSGCVMTIQGDPRSPLDASGLGWDHT